MNQLYASLQIPLVRQIGVFRLAEIFRFCHPSYLPFSPYIFSQCMTLSYRECHALIVIYHGNIRLHTFAWADSLQRCLCNMMTSMF